VRLKHACVDAGQYGVNVSPDAYRDSGRQMLRTSDLSDDGVLAQDGGVFLDGPVAAAQVLETNDLLLSRSGTIGRAYLVPEEGAGSTFAGFLVRFRPAKHTDARFLQYAIRSKRVQDQIKADAVSSTIQNFNADRYANLEIAQVTPEEQRRIADFLDDRVGRIDQIITARHLQIAHLATLLDSEGEAAFGVPAIAEAPALRLGASCSFFRDGDWIESPYITDKGVRLIQTGNVGVGTYREQGFRYVSPETTVLLKCTPVHAGDILISRLASPVGRACLCPQLGPAIASVDVTIARPMPWMDPTFVVEFLSSRRHLHDTDDLARGSTMQRVSRSQLSSVRVPRPDLALQRIVGRRLASERVFAGKRQQSLTESIALLAEYKQSLITAAVTGELDVATTGSGIPG
jgi:type I restriction enzyme S subunit